MIKTYLVDGMSCSGCVKSVTNAIKAHYPDAQVQVELEAGTVEVVGDIEDSRVSSLIEDAGFDFRGQA